MSFHVMSKYVCCLDLFGGIGFTKYIYINNRKYMAHADVSVLLLSCPGLLAQAHHHSGGLRPVTGTRDRKGRPKKHRCPLSVLSS